MAHTLNTQVPASAPASAPEQLVLCLSRTACSSPACFLCQRVDLAERSLRACPCRAAHRRPCHAVARTSLHRGLAVTAGFSGSGMRTGSGAPLSGTSWDAGSGTMAGRTRIFGLATKMGNFWLMTIPMVMPSFGSPCTNAIGKGRDGLPGGSGKMLRTTSPVRGLGSVRSRRPHRVTVSVRRYIDMNKVERHTSAYLWRSRPSRVSAPPPRGRMASAPS